MNTALDDRIKEIVVDTYLAYDTDYAAHEIYDKYLSCRESNVVREVIGKGEDTIKIEMVDLYDDIKSLFKFNTVVID